MTENKKPFEIEKEELLLVEGKDECNFFETFLQHINIQNIQIKDVGGTSQLKQKLKEITLTPGFGKVKSLAIIQDADKDATARFKSVCSALENAKALENSDLDNLEIPKRIGIFSSGHPKAGIFIIENKNGQGILEDLCLSTVENIEKIKEKCINPFLDCISQELENNSRYKPPKNKSKARLIAFLSAMEEETRSLGVAAQKSYWNFDSDSLKSLKDFLLQI